MSDEGTPRPRSGAGQSFCIPKAAIKALVDAKADALTIGAYLTLACYTDATGQYSTASVSAIYKAMGVNKGRAQKTLRRLTEITIKAKGGQATALAYPREAWIKATAEVLPDGPVERSKVLHVLPDFGEPVTERVWFGSNLVRGYGAFRQPLKRLKDAGDAAARLLLLLYQATDMPTWGGVPPSAGPWERYETTLAEDIGSVRIIHGQRSGPVMSNGLMRDVANEDANAAWAAVHSLIGSGLFYEVVLVLNRDPVKRKFSSGGEYGDVAPDAEPLYELDTRSLHGYKPKGEQGIGGYTAKTAGDLGYSVAAGTLVNEYGETVETGHQPGQFTGKYAAIVPRGYGAMIAGIYRPRFRVTNRKNAGVKDAFIRIQEGNREGLELVASIRKAKGLPPLKMPDAAPQDAEEPKPEARAMPDLSKILTDPYAVLSGSSGEPAKPRRSFREAIEEQKRQDAERRAQRGNEPPLNEDMDVLF